MFHQFLRVSLLPLGFIREARPGMLLRPDQCLRIQVLHVARVPRRDQQVLIAIEIHVEKHRRPRPVRRRDAREIRDLGEGSVAAISVERVAHELRAVLNNSRRRAHRILRRLLSFAQARIAAQHVHHDEVHEPVAIHIREIHAHGAGGHVAQGQARRETEAPPAVVQPHAVRRPEIVADIEIGKSVVIDVAEGRGQSPVERCLRQRRAVLVAEATARPRDRREAALSVVEVELVRLAVFQNLSVHHRQAILPFRRHGGPPVHQTQVHLAAIPDVFGAVVRHVEIEGTVPVHVRQRERHAAVRAAGAGGQSGVRESAAPIILKAQHALAGGRDEKLGRAIAVEIREDRPAIISPGTNDPGRFRHVLELPAAEIPVEPTGRVESAEEQVRPAVIVVVARRHAGAIEQDAIRGGGQLIDLVGEGEAGLRRREQGEASLA